MGDVRRVVHAEPDADDQEHRGGRVHRQAPEVHEAHHVDQGEDDAEQDEDGAGDVGEHEDHDEENATQGKNDASEQLLRQDPINLPEFIPGEKLYYTKNFFEQFLSCSPLRPGKGPALDTSLSNQLLHPLHGRHVLCWA